MSQKQLIAEALSPYDGLLIATKGGYERTGPSGRSDAGELIGWRPNGRPDHLRSACEANRLRELGVARRAALTLPLSAGAPGALPDTDLVATLNGRLVDRYADDPALLVVAAPVELEPFHYFLIWHPRLDTTQPNSGCATRFAPLQQQASEARPAQLASDLIAWPRRPPTKEKHGCSME